MHRHDQGADRVELVRKTDGFLVRVVERGRSSEREFIQETFARSYASGQRLRLGLRRYTETERGAGAT